MNSNFLISTQALSDRMANPSTSRNLRLFDCTTLLRQAGNTMTVESGLAAYNDAHIPGAAFLDLQRDFSDPDSDLRFTLPSAEAFNKAAADHGINNDSHLVFYATTYRMWATRLWWMFRIFGHQNVSVLDGGMKKWQSEHRPVSDQPARYQPSTYKATQKPLKVADKAAVLAALDQDDVCVINALSHEQFRGEGSHYGRPGRIKNSQSLPWNEMLDPATGCFLPAETLAQKLSATSALEAKSVITYCGGGIAASVDLFALALLGMEDKVSLYDNSMSEWANDSDAPMQTG